MTPTYTEEQRTDIEVRAKEAIETLKNLKLAPQALITKGLVTTTDGVELFADRVQTYLADTKYVAEEGKYVERKETEDAVLPTAD